MGQAPAYGPGLSRLPRAGAVMALPIVGQVLHRFAPPVMVRQSLRIAFAGRYRAARHLSDQGFADHRAMTWRMYPEVLGERRQRLAADGLDAQVRALGLPTLVVLGGADQMYPAEPSRARATPRPAPGSRCSQVPGTVSRWSDRSSSVA